MIFFAGFMLIALIAFVTALSYRSSCDREIRQRQVNRHMWWRWGWTEDGYTRTCKVCGAVQFGGDDYEGGPDAFGYVAE